MADLRSLLEPGIRHARRGHLILSTFVLLLGGACAAYGLSEDTRAGQGMTWLGAAVAFGGLLFALKTVARPWGQVPLGWILEEPTAIVWVFQRVKNGTEQTLVVCRRDGRSATLPLPFGADAEPVLRALQEGPLPHARYGYDAAAWVAWQKDPANL